MNHHFERGLLLYQQDRLAMAVEELRLAVAEEPDDPQYRATLALCLADQGQLDEAEEAAERAIGRGPEYPLAHVARTHVLHKRGRLAEAERSIAEVLRLDPTGSEAHATLAAIRFDRGNWSGALRAADDGLAYDPYHTRCATLRTMALTKLGRPGEAVEAAAEALRHDPGNANAHAAQGWARLHQSDPKAALEHFRESLRLDPTSGYARQGMIEALKARYWMYRQMLRFFLWMGRLSPRARWGVVVAIILVQVGLGELAARVPALAPLVRPVRLAVFGFAVLTLLAIPLFNLALRLNRFGRQALSVDERRQSHLVAALVLAGLAASAVWAFGDYPSSLFGESTAFSCLWLLVPASTIFQVQPGRARWVMLAYIAGMLVVYGFMIWFFIQAVNFIDRGQIAVARTWADNGWGALNLNMLAGIAASFLANWLVSRRRY